MGNKKSKKKYNQRLGRVDMSGNRILTKTQLKVLGVLLDPKYYNATGTEKRKAAGCSIYQYHKIMRDPTFNDLVTKCLLSMVHMESGAILQTAIDSAKIMGREGFPDRRMLMEMLNFYKPKQQVEHTGKDGDDIRHTVKHEFDQAKFKELYLQRTGHRGGDGDAVASRNGGSEPLHPPSSN